MPVYESSFRDPVKRIFRRMHTKKTAEPEGSDDDDGLVSVRDIFLTKEPSQIETVPESTAPQTPTESGKQLGPELGENVFRLRETIPEQAQVEEASTSKSGAQWISQMNIKAPAEEEVAKDAGMAESEGPPISQVSNEAPTRENVVGTTSPDGQPQEVATEDPEAEQDAPPVLSEVQGSLKTIFAKKAVANPQVKALLERHETVDAWELNDGLNDFARSIGATQDAG